MIDLPLDALAFLAGNVLITMFAPRLLGHPRLLLSHPSLTIGLWLGALAVSIGLLWLGTGTLIAESIARNDNPLPIDEWPTTVTGSILTWLALATLGVIAFRLIAASQAIAAERAQQIVAIAPLLQSATSLDVDGRGVSIIESDERLVAAVPFNNAIIVSSQLVAETPPTLLNAALAHEDAHLKMRHSVLVGIAQLAVTAAGGFAASRRFTQTIRIAIELAADDWAARRHGATTVADALAAIYPDDPAVSERIARLRARAH